MNNNPTKAKNKKLNLIIIYLKNINKILTISIAIFLFFIMIGYFKQNHFLKNYNLHETNEIPETTYWSKDDLD